MTTLTIYILCHNRPDETRQAIQSVLKQTDQTFILIVSDNSSNDEVEQMVKQEFSAAQYIRRQPMLPSAHHFKCVIDEAQGDYFCMFHDDDLMHPEFVSAMREAILNFPAATALACNASVEYFGKVNRYPSFRSFRKYELIASPCNLAMRYFSRSQSGIAPFPGYVYRRSQISSALLAVDGGKYSDVTWLLNIARIGQIVWLTQPLMTYRLHVGSDGGVESLRDRLRFLGYLKQNRTLMGENLIADYRCSFIYKTIAKRVGSVHLKQLKVADAFVKTYRWTRYLRLDTYRSLVNRALIKLFSR